MLVTVEQIQIGATNFIEREIASKAVGFQKFATYFVLPKINKGIVEYVNRVKGNPMAQDFFGENGKINLDELYNMAKQAIQKSGQFTVYGVILGETDIEKMHEYVKATAM